MTRRILALVMLVTGITLQRCVNVERGGKDQDHQPQVKIENEDSSCEAN